MSHIRKGSLMTVSRRRLFQSLALTAQYSAAVEGAETTVSLDTLRHVSEFHGTNLSDDRLQVVQPVLEHRLAELRSLRSFEFNDAIAPTQGVVDE